MSDTKSIINLGDLTQPAIVLIEKISDAVGGYCRPWQIRRVAQAESKAEKIKALGRIEITELQQRALVRFVSEEEKKHANMESITEKAIGGLEDHARPEQMDDDWIAYFFDKCKLVSDDEMQRLWARVLAREANSPGSYSRRTVNFVSLLDKSDAKMFTSLCSYAWSFPGEVVPLIYDLENEVYARNGVDFDVLRHLDDIGLTTFAPITTYFQDKLPEQMTTLYHGQGINIQFKGKEDNKLELGHVLLTKTGQELAPMCGSKPIPEFVDYVLGRWLDEGHVTFSNWPRKTPRPTANAHG